MFNECITLDWPVIYSAEQLHFVSIITRKLTCDKVAPLAVFMLLDKTRPLTTLGQHLSVSMWVKQYLCYQFQVESVFVVEDLII